MNSEKLTEFVAALIIYFANVSVVTVLQCLFNCSLPFYLKFLNKHFIAPEPVNRKLLYSAFGNPAPQVKWDPRAEKNVIFLQ